jgi:hypothetical protein
MADYTEQEYNNGWRGITQLPGLPAIYGRWFFVNPKVGSSGGSGSINDPCDSIVTAYGLCGDGKGDGICLISYGTGTTADTTSYLATAMTWAKSDITVFGVAAPVMWGSRARVANKTTVLTLANLITISGTNNSFYNVLFGNYGSDAAALGGVLVTGYRNYFRRCQFIGAGHATPAQTQGAYSLQLTGAQECQFDECVIGKDTIDEAGGSTINGALTFASGVERVMFRNCKIMTGYTTSSATSGAILHYGSGDSITRHIEFERCAFANYKTGAIDSNPPSYLVVGTAPNNGVLIFNYCGFYGYNAVDGANNRCYVVGPVSTGATSGKAVKVA